MRKIWDWQVVKNRKEEKGRKRGGKNKEEAGTNKKAYNIVLVN
jgi:hypothetical protein